MFKVKKLYDDAKLPIKANNGDAGFDIFSRLNITLMPQERYKFPLGFALECPDGYMVLIQSKSGLADKNGILTIGNVIDSGYRGECHAILYNSSQQPVTFIEGQKIAQMILVPCYTDKNYVIVDNLSISERESNGFGSTGEF